MIGHDTGKLNTAAFETPKKNDCGISQHVANSNAPQALSSQRQVGSTSQVASEISFSLHLTYSGYSGINKDGNPHMADETSARDTLGDKFYGPRMRTEDPTQPQPCPHPRQRPATPGSGSTSKA